MVTETNSATTKNCLHCGTNGNDTTVANGLCYYCYNVLDVIQQTAYACVVANIHYVCHLCNALIDEATGDNISKYKTDGVRYGENQSGKVCAECDRAFAVAQ